MPRKLEIKSGDKYGRWTILNEVERKVFDNGKKVRKFLCSCECGNQKEVALNSLTNGNSYSCGCFFQERCKVFNIKHGYSVNRQSCYKTWVDMRQRCNNPNNNDYKHYGGRGIKVCNRWLESFNNFLEDMGEKPEGLSIDRIDVNGNYEPSNCKWATRKEQTDNRRISQKNKKQYV
jgi:hypothetical protein